MPKPPPSTDELLALAERALSGCDGEAQALARWTRELRANGAGLRVGAATAVEVTVLRDGRAGRVVTTETDDDGLRRAAAGAGALAAATGDGTPLAARLGDPAAGRTHDGYDPAALGLEAEEAAAALAASSGGGGAYRAAAAKLAIASSRGVRATEQRSFAALRVSRAATNGSALALTEVAAGPGDVAERAARLAAEAAAGAHGAADGHDLAAAGDAESGPVVVLGPWAVAELLRLAAPAFAAGGPLAGRLGTRVVAPSINLSDSPRYPATLPWSYDAEGVPVQPVPLIQDGVAHRVVHDATSAAGASVASTGHAVLPGGLAAPAPQHLVLVGGGATALDELVAGAGDGLLIPSLRAADGGWDATAGGVAAFAHGVRAIRDGATHEWHGTVPVRVDPFAVLAQVQALTASQRTVPVPGRPAWAAAATVAPALRAGGGVLLSHG
jgi:predicted Zn-dependent protease